MYKVERAIIMAAGKGQRMQPVTFDTPKPLIRINGVRMIDTIIQALHENGIYEIYIVVGYLKDQFYVLHDEYDGIHIIDNPYFDACNNISSLYVARDHIKNSIILDGDQLVHNPAILTPDFEYSGYNSIWTDTHTDEWLQTIDSDGRVVSCSRTGGQNGWQLFSVSRWTKEDGARLKGHLETEFDIKNNRQIYWDDVAMFCYPEQYNLHVRPMNPGDLEELDNLNELIAVDPSYADYKGGDSNAN